MQHDEEPGADPTIMVSKEPARIRLMAPRDPVGPDAVVMIEIRCLKVSIRAGLTARQLVCLIDEARAYLRAANHETTLGGD